MNLENLRNKKEVKNYKEMCALIEEKEKSGNSRKAQIKEWERFIKFHKEGQKYIIDEFYDIPLSKEDARIDGNNSLYGKSIQKLVLDLLSQDENCGQLFLSCNQLLRELQMVSVNYARGRRDIPLLSSLLNVDEDIIEDVYEYTHNKLKSALECALNNLAKQSWITWNKKKTVCIKSVKPLLNDLNEIAIDENGMPMFNITTEYREATVEEVQEILKYESIYLDNFECESKRDLLIRGKLNEFRILVNKELKKHCNIEFYYESYEIISHKSTLVERLGRFEKVGFFDSLNETILENTYKSIETKHNNSLEKTEWISQENIKQRDAIRSDEEYVDMSKTVVDKIIPRKARKIKGLWDEK